MPLNADQLEAFWMVVTTGSFHKAAETLFITQSAVTQRVRALEAAVGAPLFVRAGRGVTLTPAGERLSHHCRAQREAEAAVLRALRGEAEGLVGRLAVASGSEEGRIWVLPALAAVAEAHPALDIELVIDDATDGQALLANSRVDVVIGDRLIRRRGVRCERLGALAHALVASPAIAGDWPESPSQAQLLSVRAIDFHAQDRITLDFLELAVPEADWSGLKRYFVDDAHAICQWVLAGGGFSVLPRALVAPHLAAGTLRRFYADVQRERVLYWSTPEAGSPPAVQVLAAALAARID